MTDVTRWMSSIDYEGRLGPKERAFIRLFNREWRGIYSAENILGDEVRRERGRARKAQRSDPLNNPVGTLELESAEGVEGSHFSRGDSKARLALTARLKAITPGVGMREQVPKLTHEQCSIRLRLAWLED